MDNINESIFIDVTGMAISKKCWIFIKTFLHEINCKKIIEFGAGISTKLLNSIGLSVYSIETEKGFIEKLKETEYNIFIYWDGKEEIKLPKDFNVSFIDGPKGGKNREYSYKISSESPNIEYIICHDVDRIDDRVWINKYLKKGWILYKKDNRKIEIYKRV